MKKYIISVIALTILLLSNNLIAQVTQERTQSFNNGWKFFLGDNSSAASLSFDDAGWRNLNLPHDWSIELPFDKESPTGTGGGALRGGIGWYRKVFTLPLFTKDKFVAINFDGIYCNSEVWINEHYLGKRPNGYISFQYDLSPYLKYGNQKNVIAIRVDNSQQPNSRWYSGSGIYRNVWLTISNKLHIGYNGTHITTSEINSKSAKIELETTIDIPANSLQNVSAITTLFTNAGKQVARTSSPVLLKDSQFITRQRFIINNPTLWSVDKPYLYKAVTQLLLNGKVADEYSTFFGIRSFEFDSDKGFLLNGKVVKINGVCNHHDLGCLGTAVNKAALKRQLLILKEMGCNGIRTSHNPPAPELLDLCDQMGFIVIDEAFDMWKKQKNPYDYHLYWDQWHKRDLEDMILRDRNHPSVFIWSIGNEIMEQWNDKDSSGIFITKELVNIIKSLDTTRPITSALSNPYPKNPLIRSGALDLIGYNYDHKDYGTFHNRFPGKKFIATETVSALETRGYYDLIPSDSIRRWSDIRNKPTSKGKSDLTVSAYDNVSTPWGSTHEETWKQIKKYPFLSGQYIWTGFDYIGEPTPYPWPARSSYFGIIDLAGFPKDVYYMYQSEWTNKPVLHIFPHWNWEKGDTVDIWAYYNHADEVELFLNGRSLGTRNKMNDDLHVKWRVPFTPGILKAVSKKEGKIVLTQVIKTAGKPAKIILTSDRKSIHADGKDLAFITVKIEDKDGNIVPDADNQVRFTINGNGFLAGVDNGSQTSMESFKASERKAFNGLCLAVIQSNGKNGPISLKAISDGLQPATILVGTTK